MISVEDALAHVFKLADLMETENVPLREATGRVLAKPVVAERAHPPFRASIMDGYAVAGEHDSYDVVGETAAGGTVDAELLPGQAMRVFTGAPVPDGATRVVIQEDVQREEDRIALNPNADKQVYIREIGRDFNVGDQIDAPHRMTPALVAFAAAMNAPEIAVAKRPKVAFIATGSELVMPGEAPTPSQIIASNSLALAALAEAEGADARMLPIAADKRESLEAAFALTEGVDLIVTIGGASVGDYDLVGQVAANLGLDQAFYKVAMRPGKPLMAGRLKGTPMLGLPGNPVSSIVCGHIFMRPLLRAMQGLPKVAMQTQTGILAASIGANGPREHYMRAQRNGIHLTVAERQDSALLSVLAGSNALVIRPPLHPAQKIGAEVSFIDF